MSAGPVLWSKSPDPQTVPAVFNCQMSLFDPIDLTNSLIRSMAVLPDGRLLLAGTFTEVNGVPRPGLARLSRDGTLDDEFEPNRDGGPPGWAPVIPASLAPLPGGDVLIGLPIPMYNGVKPVFLTFEEQMLQIRS